jgi:hypothetical protein
MVIELINLDCKTEKHIEQETDGQNGKTNRKIFFAIIYSEGDTRWRSLLRHCATSRKVAGSIPDGVIGIFHWHNPSGRTMAWGRLSL